MPAESFVDPLASSPFLGILRGIREQAIEPLVEAVVSAGLRALEITMNTKGAPGLIRRPHPRGRADLYPL